MNKRPLPVGVENFEKLVSNDYYFVDKSLLIKDILDKKGDVNIFTRPRRFGKTLNLSMLQYFFEDARDEEGNKIDHTSLFDGLNIMSAGNIYKNFMGIYPVISLTLKSAKQPDFENSVSQIIRAVADEFRRHSFILADKRLEDRKERYLLLMREKADRKDGNDALKFLTECLHIYYGKKVILLIDEYDVPLETAYFRGFYPEMSDYMRSLFESVLKTNNNLEFAVITGCLRISKESIFTGLNNLEIISVLSKNYDEYFGFTENEVIHLCDEYELQDKMELIRNWYDGYLFGNANVYNPWSVIRFIKDHVADRDELPSAYWANTSSNDIVRRLIERADDSVREEIETLIYGKTVTKPIHEDITYEEIEDSMDNLWNFMFFTGYFRKENEWMDIQTGQKYLTLTIPNEEIRYIFRNKVLKWFQEKVKERDRTALFQAVVKQDCQKIENDLQAMLMKTISFYDAYESFYHGFLAGVLYGMDEYVVKSNRESGNGRTDLFLIPVSRRKTAFIFELKVSDSYKNLEKAAENAIAQIDQRNYETELIEAGYEDIYKYGIAFFKKDCLVKGSR